MSSMDAIMEALRNVSIDEGGCPAPFLSETFFPYTEGYHRGRNCAPNPLLDTPDRPRCCIPCPVFEWTYSEHFDQRLRGTGWTNVAGLILCGFLLVSHVALPAAVTQLTFLNVALLISIVILQLGFIIPLAEQPPQCWDSVTPNDMNSQNVCAITGALLALGLLSYVIFIMVRSIFMHLQICWDTHPHVRAYIAASVLVWAVTVGLTAGTMAYPGISYRFGGYCYINNFGSEKTYWGFTLAFGCLALILQLITFVYCVRVYAMAAIATHQQRKNTGSKSILSGSPRSRKIRATAFRVKKIIMLQWRSFVITVRAIFTIAFVTYVFIYLDHKRDAAAFTETEVVVPWIVCLLTTQDKNQCLDLVNDWIVSENVTLATWYILAFVGIETFFLLFRLSIFTGWWDLFQRVILKRNPPSRTRARPQSERPQSERPRSEQATSRIELCPSIRTGTGKTASLPDHDHYDDEIF